MKYVSTRGKGEPKGFSDILLEGLAADGGLYMPEKYPRFSAEDLEKMRSMKYPELAFTVLSKYIDDIPPLDLRRIVDETYKAEIFGPNIVPVRRLDDDFYLLKLSEGPTLAFKDIALQLLGRLFEYVLAKSDRELNILGATSGDTGSAAEYAMRGRKGVKVFMLSPHGRMSEFQRKQMYTLQDENIFNIAIRGTFDDCQDIVKAVNDDADFKQKFNIGAVNSINWARIAAQVVFYFWGYFRSISLTTSRTTKSNHQLVSFAVPTGNFGNILAGYIAYRMGLPIKRLVLATNENDVLAEFFPPGGASAFGGHTGTYRPRKGNEVAATSSPSMDISKASNFERYIFDLVERNAHRMYEIWGQLEKDGMFKLSPEELTQLRSDIFAAGSSTHADRLDTIRMIHEKYGVLIDPHTADGVKVGLEYRDVGVPLIALETAKAAKFSATIHEAIGKDPPVLTSFSRLLDLPERFEVMDVNPSLIKSYIGKKCA